MAKLEKCFTVLINRHEALRTYFELQNGNVVQKIIENYEAHEYSIYSCVEINDENVASGGEDTLIKLWKN